MRFVPLAAVRDPDLVATTVAQAARPPETGDAPAARRAWWLPCAAPRRCWCWTTSSTCSRPPRSSATLLAACPRLKILVDQPGAAARGRRACAPGAAAGRCPTPEYAVSCDDLMRSAAVRLFVERARRSSPSFALTDDNAPLVAEICRRLDGLPLAIELAAARVTHLSLPALLARLERRLPLLTGGARDRPPAADDARRDRLEPRPARRPRSRRSSGGWPSSPAASRWRRPKRRWRTARRRRRTIRRRLTLAASVLDGIAALVDASLLQAETGPDGTARYRMLETIREFALERLAASGEAETVRQRHAAYFLALAERYELAELLPDGDQVLALLEAEHANLRAALAWLEEAGESRAVPPARGRAGPLLVRPRPLPGGPRLAGTRPGARRHGDGRSGESPRRARHDSRSIKGRTGKRRPA